LQNKIVKVILETGALTENQILELADIVAEANANFVKTSTGYYEKGVSLDAVKLLRKHLPEKIGIKASGGIKTREFALDLLNAGANRLGTSSAKYLLK
jgi:deoxyribose-phosphate aldolase